MNKLYFIIYFFLCREESDLLSSNELDDLPMNLVDDQSSHDIYQSETNTNFEYGSENEIPDDNKNKGWGRFTTIFIYNSVTDLF